MKAVPLAAFALGVTAAVAGETPPRVVVSRAGAAITIDGNLDDAGWTEAVQIRDFYEISPGDNLPAKVRTTAWLTYDDRFFYVAFKCDDPSPRAIRAQFTERDRVFSDQDFIGIMLDTRNDGRTAQEFWINPYGILDDAVSNEANVSGNQEDFAPDFYWDGAAKITSEGWQAEMRIPFSSLRYSRADPQTWGAVVLRNWPRDFRYQFASNRSPRDSNCFLCHALKLDGLTGLPRGVHGVVAPYGTAREEGVPRERPGSAFANRPVRLDGGVDAKLLPNENTAIDATVNPDFSQIESDVAQISANTRFALFYPEKRPFFMEQSQLFQTPIQAVYTRTITSPRWGARATGQFGDNVYTVLAGEDRGGGTVILPGPEASSSAPQDFRSTFAIARVQHAFAGRSYISLLATDREVSGGGHNRVLGPDFQWTPDDHNQVVGQLLFSSTQTPDRPDLSPDWNGRAFDSRALYATWNHSSLHWIWYATYRDLGEGFRADDGFVPQVGVREAQAQGNYLVYTDGFFSRIIPFLAVDSVTASGGSIVTTTVEPGIGLRGKSALSFDMSYTAVDRERAGPRLLPNEHLFLSVSAAPPGPFSSISLTAHAGRAIDFLDFRDGHGGDATLALTIRPTRHLQCDANLAGQWLYRSGQRLFQAQVERLKATYVFRPTTFVRVIGQYVRTDFNPSLYTTAVPRRSGGLDASALFGYQLNWQSVLYVGYGDSRALDEQGQLQRSGREFFLKVSYAFQK
jgi:hypothetical protein